MHANRNKKAIKRVERGMMKANRIRNLFAVFAIVLTTFMITTVFSLGINYMENMKLMQVRTAGTTANASLAMPTEKQEQQIKNLEYVKTVGTQYMVGSVAEKNDEGRDLSIALSYYDPTEWEKHYKETIKDTGIEDYVTVGEMSSTTLEHCIRYSGAEEKELSMCFNFHHLKVDYKDGNKWELMEPDYMELKVIFEKWQMGMQRGNAWNALFWCNHDQPRIVSRFGNEGEYWKESAKMLAGMIHLMRGTPYIYQGEEIGMTNPHYTSIEQYADVESRNYYEILLNEGKTKEEALEILAARSRDNSRTPMQWTDERYCGFSDTKPWIPVSDNFEKINVKKQKQDRDSILEFYKKLIMLRKEKEVIARGNIEFMEVENAGVLAYTRCLDKQKLLVCCNFRDVESQMEFTQEWKSGRKILGNYEENHKNNYKVLTLRPYEIIVLEKGEE